MKKSTTSDARKLRADIQSLRGFAVLIVVIYHAKISFISGGYLGVDVFFVISGFLITRLIKGGIERGDFRFSDFYFRRAKRLLPAAYVTFLVTVISAPLFLASSEMRDLIAQVAGAVTFTANIVLLQQAGYFGGAAELKPLLHVWSLAIEEQYYLILPATMVVIPRRYWLPAAVIILSTSLALCFLQAGKESTFYLLPTRAWELAIGSIGALLTRSDWLGRLGKLLFWPALVLLITLPVMQVGSFHPGLDALLICLATLIIILRQHPIMFDWWGAQGLSKIGDISYSLYLVHWPLFAFYNNVWIGESSEARPVGVSIGLIVLSLLLAHLLYRYVEAPIHKAEIKRRKPFLVRIITASLGLVFGTVGVTQAFQDDRDYGHIRRVNYGLSEACEFQQRFEPLEECQSSVEPRLLVWGDSFAMHLVPGIADSTLRGSGVVQATKSECGPLIGLAMYRDKERNDRKWAQSCIEFSESVVRYLKDAKSIDTVVISSPFSYFMQPGERLLKWSSHEQAYQIVDASVTEALEGLKKTVESVRSLGKRIVLIAPPPSNGADPSRCVERLHRRLPSMGDNANCGIEVSAYRQKWKYVLKYLESAPLEADVEVISFDSYLCDSGLCMTHDGGTLIYRDPFHLSYDGSVFLARKMSLLRLIDEAAR